MLSYLAHGGVEAGSYLSSGEVSINWYAIILATIAAMIIGSVWYGPLYGKKWMKAVGLKKEDMQGSWWPIAAMLGLSLAQSIILAHFIAYTANFYFDLPSWTVGVLTGLWAFAGFVAPVLIANTMFAKGSTVLLKLNLGNQLLTLLIMGAILGSIN